MSQIELAEQINRAAALSTEYRHREVLAALEGAPYSTALGLALAAFSHSHLLAFDTARWLVDQALPHCKTDPATAALVGHTLLRLGDITFGEAILANVVDTVSPEFGGLLVLCALYLAENRPSAAIDAIARARAAFPYSAMGANMGGQVLASAAAMLGSPFLDSQGLEVPENFISTVQWRWAEMLNERPMLRALAPIHVVGDSHAQIFSGTTLFWPIVPEPMPALMAPFVTHNLGAVLGYNLGRYGTRIGGREKLDWLRATGRIPPGGTIMLSVGEIDLRAHVAPQAERQGVPETTVIDGIVASVIGVAEELIAAGHPVLLWAPIGAAPDRPGLNWYGTPAGTEPERNARVRAYNQRLAAAAAHRGIFVLSVFDMMVSANDLTDERFLFDGLHLGFWALPMIQEAFRRTFPIIA